MKNHVVFGLQETLYFIADHELVDRREILICFAQQVSRIFEEQL